MSLADELRTEILKDQIRSAIPESSFSVSDPQFARYKTPEVPESFATTAEPASTVVMPQMAGEPKATIRTPGKTTPPTFEEILKARRERAIELSGKTKFQRLINSLALGAAKGFSGGMGVSSELAPYEEIGMAAPTMAGDIAGQLYGYAGLKSIASQLAIPLLGASGRAGAITRWGTLGGAGGAAMPAESAKERLRNAALGATLFAGGEAVSPYAAKLLSKLTSKVTKPAMEQLKRGTRFEAPAVGSVGEQIRSGATLFETIPPVSPTKEFGGALERLTEVLKKAKPVRKEQAEIYKKERAAKFGKARGVQEKYTKQGKLIGEEAFRVEKGVQTGEMTKAAFEELRGDLSQYDIDLIMHRIATEPSLYYGETMTARTGFQKMLEGRVPTNKELDLLGQIFPDDFMKTLLAKRPLMAKAKEVGIQLINAPRTILASFDMSYGLRQGAFAGWKYRNEWWKSWKAQFGEFGSEKAYQATREALIQDPQYKMWREAGVDFTDVGSVLSKREEPFISSWVEQIPGIGQGVRASNRAYTGFANKYRLDIAKSLAKDIEGMGIDVYQNPLMKKQIARFVNNATGRGELGALENSALLLNGIFFSPRLAMSRLRTMNPVFYAKLPKGLRKEALKTAFHSAGAAVTLLSAARLAGADVEASPFSADFGKMKIGNTRVDMTAGYAPYLRGIAQVLLGKMKSSTTGQRIDLSGKEFGKPTRLDIFYRQVESRTSPVASYIISGMRGRNWRGEEFKLERETAALVLPIITQDIRELLEEDPELLGLAVAAFFGASIQSYPSKSTTHKGRSGRKGRTESKGRR
jgi:hypothetical protein